MLFALLPPLPSRAAAIPIPVAAPDIAQMLLEFFGIVSGIQGATPSASPTVCRCVNQNCTYTMYATGAPVICTTPPFHMQIHETGNWRWCSITQRWLDVTYADAHVTALLQNIHDIDDETIARAISAMISPEYGWDPGSQLPQRPRPDGQGMFPYIPFLMGINDVEALLSDWTELLMYGYEMRWCFFSQDYRPFPINQPERSPVITGFKNGMPVIDPAAMSGVWGFDMAQPAATINIAQEWFSQIRSVIPKQINVNGNTYSLVISQPNNIISLHRNGQFVRQVGSQSREEIDFGFVVRADEPSKVWLLYYGVYGNRTHCTGGFVDINLDNAPITQPQAPPLILQQPNFLEDPDAIMQLIREIGIAPDSDSDELVVMIPLITPDMFPEISPEHFPQFALDLLENLLLEHLIFPWQELPNINIINLPPLPQRPPVIPPPIDYTRNLNDILIELRRQTRELEGINRRLGELPPSQQVEIEDLSLEIDFEGPSMPFLFDFSSMIDRMPNLMEYFPFSLPHDMYNTFRVISGQMPMQTVGMTYQETVAFMAMYENNINIESGEIMMLSAQETGMQPMNLTTQPMFLTTTAPRFEINIPAPFNYTFVFDMGEYPQLIGVIRWSILVMFVFALYKMTPLLIKW
jgi:hypothetical protein